MKRPQDIWYVRLPSGQELRAKSTKAVAHHVETGVIPRSSMVRRSPTQEWTRLEWTNEFSSCLNGNRPSATGSRPEIAFPVGIASRLDPLRLRTVGVRGLWEDLLAALDSAWSRAKLLLTAMATVAAALMLTLMPWLGKKVGVDAAPIAGLLIVLLLGALNGLLARMTYLELSQLRPCSVREASRGFFPLLFRLMVAYFLVAGSCVLVAGFFRAAPTALGPSFANWGFSESAVLWLQSGVHVIGAAIEVLLWLLLALTGLLAPVLVIEEGDVFAALGSWWRLLRDHTGRVLLGEALALILGGLLSVPFAAALGLALHGRSFPPGLIANLVETMAIALALSPLFAVLAVANVTIYLDVRYEQG